MKKIEDSDKKLFGKYAVALSGFNEDEQKSLINLFDSALKGLKVIFVEDAIKDETLDKIFKKEHKYGFLKSLYVKRAIIMSGFLEKDIVPFMKTVRASGIYPELWAVLTQTSNNWKFSELAAELEKEAEEIKKMQQSKKT